MILVISKIYVLHGSVATQLKCGEILNNYFIFSFYGINQ